MTTEFHHPRQHIQSTGHENADHDVSAHAPVHVDREKVAEDCALVAMRWSVISVVGMKPDNFVTCAKKENQIQNQKIPDA